MGGPSFCLAFPPVPMQGTIMARSFFGSGLRSPPAVAVRPPRFPRVRWLSGCRGCAVLGSGASASALWRMRGWWGDAYLTHFWAFNGRLVRRASRADPSK